MTAITLDKIISRKAVFASRVNDDLVIMDQDSGKYFTSGGVGADIWDLIEKPRSVQEICDAICDMYDVPPETCSAEVQAFINDLLKAGIINIAEE